MAKVSPQTLMIIFNLQRRLVELIDQAKTAEYNLFEAYGETEETIPELEQLQNGAERLRNPYSRLATLTLAIAEAQPIAPAAMINSLYTEKSISVVEMFHLTFLRPLLKG